MLPSLLVQLLIQTSHALVHTMLFLVAEESDVRFGLVDVGLCITYMGKTKISCSLGSLEIIRQVLIQKWLLYYTTRFNNKNSGILHEQHVHVFRMMLPVSSYYLPNSYKFPGGVHKEAKMFSLLCRNRILVGRFRWPAVHLLVLRVRIPPGAWTSVCCECCVLSGRGHCVGLIIRAEVPCPVWCV